MNKENKDPQEADTGPLPDIKLDRPENKIDFATVIGLIAAIGMIVFAIAIGKSDANFFNGPSFMIVVLGTMAATAVSYTGKELKGAGSLIAKSTFRRVQNPSNVAQVLLSLAVIAKKKGALSLSKYDNELRKDEFMQRAIQLAVDGYQPEEIERTLFQEIDALKDRHKRSASITRRASEVAPAMGLIGTLVGLVQMLADLENPETIGPAMAVALLTTFYGAIMGTVIMAPLAVKLEKNSSDEALIKTLIVTAATSIARQENPRRLEMLLNADLPPAEQIRYFD